MRRNILIRKYLATHQIISYVLTVYHNFLMGEMLTDLAIQFEKKNCVALEIHSNRLTWQQSNDYRRNEYSIVCRRISQC